MTKARDRSHTEKDADKDEVAVKDTATVNGEAVDADEAEHEVKDLGASDKNSDVGIEGDTMTDKAAEKIQAERKGEVEQGTTTDEGSETAADKVDEDQVMNPDADPAKFENKAVNVKEATGNAVQTNKRGNIEEFTKDYQGQLYQVTATVDDKMDVIVGYTNDPTGGGLVELVDGSDNMRGPHIVKLTPEEKQKLWEKKPVTE